jgi:hypothetical protein
LWNALKSHGGHEHVAVGTHAHWFYRSVLVTSTLEIKP